MGGIWSPCVPVRRCGLDYIDCRLSIEAKFGTDGFADTRIHVQGLQRSGAIGGLLRDHRLWQPDGCYRSNTLLAIERYMDSMLLGKTPNNEQSKEAAGRFIECRRIGDTSVEVT